MRDDQTENIRTRLRASECGVDEDQHFGMAASCLLSLNVWAVGHVIAYNLNNFIFFLVSFYGEASSRVLQRI